MKLIGEIKIIKIRIDTQKKKETKRRTFDKIFTDLSTTSRNIFVRGNINRYIYLLTKNILTHSC